MNGWILLSLFRDRFRNNPVQKSMFKEVVDANFSYEYWRQLSDGRLMVEGSTGHGLGLR
jgi:hypothetical protein